MRRKTASFGILFSPRMGIQLFYGFLSGLPLLLTGSTLQAWMVESQVSLSAIGAFSLVGLPYSLKIAWSPFLDRFTLGKMGRRRGWLFLTRLSLAGALLVMSLCDPGAHLTWVVGVAVLITFLSASQDIVADAFRREIMADEEIGLATAYFINGYRLGLLFAGAFALYLSSVLTWVRVYQLMAVVMVAGALLGLMIRDSATAQTHPKSLREAIVEPLLEYFRRDHAWKILAFILLYKAGDAMASNLFTPFFLQMGITKVEIATIAKTFGLAATLVGGMVGGILILNLGILRSLWIFGILQALSTACFSWWAWTGATYASFAYVIAFENLTSGMGSASYGAFMATLTNRKFTATQYALFSSLMGIPRVILASPTGKMAEVLGWPGFFIFCAVAAVPGLLLLRGSWAREKPR